MPSDNKTQNKENIENAGTVQSQDVYKAMIHFMILVQHGTGYISRGAEVAEATAPAAETVC